MSEEKLEGNEKIFSKSCLIVGTISAVLSFVPGINYLAIVAGTITIIYGILGLFETEKKKVACIGIILGVLSIIITYFIMSNNIQFLKNNVYDISNEQNTENNDSDYVLKNEVEVVIGEFEQNNETFDGEFYNNMTKLPVTLNNKSKTMKSFNITIEAVDEDGNRIIEETVYVEKLRPGQSYKTEAFSYASGDMMEKLENAKFVVLDASSY